MKRLYLSDTVAGEISAYIAKEQLAPGARLPSVGEWMERLEVGRSTLREGLKKLQAEGIIEVVNGKGIFVSEQRTFQLLASLGIHDARAHLLEMLEVRQALEAQAIQLAVRHAEEAAFEAMAGHLDDYRRARAREDFLAVSEADAAFHLAIYQACGNRVLVGLIQMMHDELYLSWDSPDDRHEVFDASFAHHEDLLEAMRRRDEQAALAAFDNLVGATRKSIEAMVS
ncbi:MULTISPECIES: FCD domain-containing protein [unclassified Halomonas]|uniref:FadR/GntR family transcriptional regulator n=1 Tax=unclassified Halomonas TaxID=2609666 RepID=UPI0006963ABB|nr:MULTISPECIES: FCD domain-containing protein [unclassified Halomonas]MBR9882114.1 FadR family transcriptional regulator [Gammaproteobacteria bacterium]MCO7215924.1 FCD domain-containing protein [Halomonas sp. OfavH-34-E]